MHCWRQHGPKVAGKKMRQQVEGKCPNGNLSVRESDIAFCLVFISITYEAGDQSPQSTPRIINFAFY